MEEFLTKLAELSPLLVALVAGVGGAWFLFWQAERLERKLSEQVGDKVASEMSKRLVELQGLTERASKQTDELGQFLTQAQGEAEEFRQEVARLREEAHEEADGLRRLLGEVKIEVPPDLEWIAARSLVLQARDSQDWRAVSLLVSQVLKDENATAQDLEWAGDEARKHRAFRQAMELYEKAVNLDPERKATRVELLALTAETNHGRRDEALRQLEELIERPPLQRSWLSRYFDALIEVDRYQQMARFCEGLLERSLEIGLTTELAAYVHRNLAVAYRGSSRLQDALREYELAYRDLPQDEDVVRPYANLLRDMDNWEGYLRLAVQLVNLDPADPNYAYYMAVSMEHQGQDQETLAWIQRARILHPDGVTTQLLGRLERRVQAKLSLPSTE